MVLQSIHGPKQTTAGSFKPNGTGWLFRSLHKPHPSRFCCHSTVRLGIDEQLIMFRTGHSSTGGVRTYKRTSEKLKELTSDALNGITVSSDAPVSKKVKVNPMAVDENIAPADYKQPVFQISGGSNITINISSK